MRDRSKPYEADVLPGTAFMIRKDLFNGLGGFDENFFLYFEESDLFKRVKEEGYKLYILPKARLTHFWAVSTPPSDKIRKIFRESRFYYFKKNFGIFSALLVDFFARLSLTSVLLFLILALGIFLRFYRLPQNMIFNGEMGYDYMTIRTFIENHQIPLIGPRTSHEWFFIGPLFYWIFGILLPLFNYHVAVGAYFFAVTGVASILICYLVIKSLFGEKPAIISSFLLSFSPLWLQLTRDARFNGLTALLFLPFYYLLVKSVENKGRSLFLLGLTLGVMFSFFPSPILLLPGSIVVLFIYRKNINRKYLVNGVAGLTIPVLPWLLYNAEHKFNLLINIFAWVPYRVLGFIGIYPKNTVTPGVFMDNFTGVYNFFQASYFYRNNILIFLLFTLTFIFVLFKARKSLALNILIIVSLVSYIGLFLHGNPPSHYYLVIYPVPLIFLSLLLDKISKRAFWLTILLLGGLFVFNLRYYFSDRWFFVDSIHMSADGNYVPYSLQIKVVKFVAEDAGSQKFSIGRVGPLDYFGENFSLNYQYLLWSFGNKPDQSASLKYTIYEDTKALPKNEKVYWIENIAVSKNE